MRFPLERRAMDFSISRLTLDTEAAALSAALFVVSAIATLKVLRYTFLLIVTCATSQGNSLVFCHTPHSTAKAVATAPVCSHLTSCADMSAAPIHQRSTSIICGCKAGAPSGRASEPTVVILFQENFIFMVLLARSRGYSRPWFRRLHSNKHKRFEMFTSLRVFLFHVSKFVNDLHFVRFSAKINYFYL